MALYRESPTGRFEISNGFPIAFYGTFDITRNGFCSLDEDMSLVIYRDVSGPYRFVCPLKLVLSVSSQIAVFKLLTWSSINLPEKEMIVFVCTVFFKNSF